MSIQNNILLVSGAKYSCLYDLNTKKLYHIDDVYADYFRRLREGADPEELPGEVVDSFRKAGFIVREDELLPGIPEYTWQGQIDFAWVEITRNCNLFCRHCYEESARTVHVPEMTAEDFRKAADCLRKAGVRRVQLVGGEPLTHSRFREFLDYLDGKFDFIEIYTNGTLLTEELLDIIRDRRINLAFSVYGDRPETHDYVTCTKGSYDRTMKMIRRALDREIPVRTAAVEMVRVPRFQMEDERIRHRVDLPRLTGRASLALYDRDMLERKLITKKTFAKPIDPALVKKSMAVHNCFAEKLYIDCGLEVYPCAMERRFSYGNLREKPLEEMIGNPWMKRNKDTIKGCKDCEFRYACYDCRPDCGGAPVDAKPWYCTYDPENGAWMDKEKFMDSLMKRKEG